MNRTISVVIPHYNNVKFMKETLEYIVNDNRVSEIIICDDCSIEFDDLHALITEFNNNKIILFKNDVNLGCYHNKLHTVSKCTNDWCILLDSDNIINRDYIDILFNIDNWDNNLIYAPMWAKTFPDKPSENLNYSEYSNMLVDSKNYIQLFQQTKFQCLINTCNYFLPTYNFLKAMNKYKYERKIIDSLDSAVLFTDWLCDNHNVIVVENLTYSHRLHSNSNYVLSDSKKHSNSVKKYLIDKIKTLLIKK